MGDERGVHALRLAAGGKHPGLDDVLIHLNGPVDQALWAHVHHPELWARADDMLSCDALIGRGAAFFNRFEAQPHLNLVPDGVVCNAFEAAVTEIFQEFKWPTDRLKIEPIERPAIYVGGEMVIQVTIRHGQLPEAHADFSKVEIDVVRYRPVRDTFIYFHPPSGRLDIVAERGGAKLRAALAAGFCETVLSQRPPDVVETLELDLTSLNQPRSFVTDPTAGIEEVRLVSLTMSSREGHKDQVQADLGAELWDLPTVIDAVRALLMAPTRAVLEFTFLPASRSRPATARQAKLSAPNGASYPRATPLQRSVMERHLKTWGLIGAPDPSAL